MLDDVVSFAQIIVYLCDTALAWNQNYAAYVQICRLKKKCASVTKKHNQSQTHELVKHCIPTIFLKYMPNTITHNVESFILVDALKATRARSLTESMLRTEQRAKDAH